MKALAIRAAATAGMACFLLGAAVGLESPRPDPEAVVAEGCGLETTADDSQSDSIRELLRSAAEAGTLAGVTVDYPLDATVFPPDLAPPTLLWHDASSADRWLLEAAFGDGPCRIRVLAAAGPPSEGEIDPRCIAVTNELYVPTPYQASAKAWRPSETLWAVIKKHSTERPSTLTFLGFRRDAPDRVLSRGSVTFRTSKDPVGAPIFYRDVPLMPSKGQDGVIKPLDQTALPLIEWRLKDVSRPDSRMLLSDMPTCANCHSFSADGKTLGMDLDGPDGDKGAYAITTVDGRAVIDDPQVMTWNAFPGRIEGRLIFGFLSRVSPSGQHVVSTVNEALYVRNFTDYRFLQVFYPTRGILAYYTRATGEIRALPGADDPNYVHCNPVWTPDGKTLVFARARARDPYDRNQPVATYTGDPNETPIRFDLYRIPWNEGRGGRPDPIAGASANGISNSFPKVTPDGRFIVFVKSANGMLMRPDGKLWIVPVGGGEARLMRCNTPLMNSWHSFSPNGRWMVFSSKQNRPYTQMFLTHLDEDGNDSPPILVEGATAANRAVNIPEFVNLAYDGFTAIAVPAVDHYEHFGRGNELARAGQERAAVAEYEEALEGENKDWRINDWRIHDSMSKVLLRLGQRDRAVEHIRESLRLNPWNAEMHANLGYVLFEQGGLAEAREHLDTALKLAPGSSQAWHNRAVLRLTLGDGAGAIQDYGEAIRLDPQYADAYSGRGIARSAAGDRAGALEDFAAAIRLKPDDPTPRYFRGRTRWETGDRVGALEDLDRAIALCPPGSPRAAEIQALRRTVAEGPPTDP